MATMRGTVPWRRPLALCALLLLSLSLPAAPSAAQDDARLAAARERVKAVRAELTAGESALRQAETQMAKVTAGLRESRRRERQIAGELAKLEGERRTLEARLAAQTEALARDVRDAWITGRQPPLQRWLSADDPQEAARIARYHDYLNQARVERLETWRAAQAALAAVEARLAAEQATLRDTQAALQTQEGELRTLATQRREAVSRLAGELRTERQQLKRLEEDAAALRRLAGRAREAFREVPPEAVGAPLAQRRGKLRWPVAGRLATRFGSSMAEGKLRSNGIVISAAEGSPVKAVHAGRVVWADWLRGYGLLLILDHGDGFLSIYGHNQGLARSVGDWVSEGDTLASVGNSGGRADAGLYFELRHHGQPQDPGRWLRQP